MHTNRYILAWLVILLFTQAAFSQLNRIPYNNQQLFLNGSNLAWVQWGQDWGLGTTDTTTMAEWMLQMHQHGGNAMRLWLNVEGTITPKFDSHGRCTGPGPELIPELKKVLDLAWDREIGLDICLWGFGMLSTRLDTTVWSRNMLLLTDTSFTNAYIRNCLIPMVTALKGHPGIVCWEIFNEPEGMSNEFGWSGYKLVPMQFIQRFVNLCGGAIHRTDPGAKVTNGAWSFFALTDNTLAKASTSLSKLSSIEKREITTFLQQKYRLSLTPDEIMLHLEKIADGPHQNYYRDDRLIAAGGDPDGILDFYSVHYYSTSTPISTSPFHQPANSWGLNKPIAVAEFAMEAGKGAPLGIPIASLYETLYQLGYAGALAWSWTDLNLSSHANMLTGMQSLWDAHRSDVDLLGAGGDWPIVNITSPQNGATFPDSNKVTIQVEVIDSAAINSVAIFVSDTVKLVELTTAPYTYTWTNIAGGVYNITAVATNSLGHIRTSGIVKITVGKPPMVRLEAETAVLKGSGMSVGTNDVTASNSKYLNIQTNDTNSTITWKLTSVPAAGNYPMTFGFKLNYASPKSQFLNVNGARVDTVEFISATTSKWYEKTIYVDLIKDTNTIQMQMFWGWMYLDYLGVPTSIVPTAVDNTTGNTPISFVLEQNYPNPFNPSTLIRYSLLHSEFVKLFVYDVLGRQVAHLVDGKQSAGIYEIPFNAALLPSGVYFYRIDAGTFTESKKMIILK